MKKVFALFLALALTLSCLFLMPTKAEAANIVASGNFDAMDIKWVLTSDKVLTFSGKGDIPNMGGVINGAWHRYANSVRTVVIEKGITGIGDSAFHDFTRLKTLKISSSVKSIGENAFNGCINLKKISLPGGVVEVGVGAFHNTGWYNNKPIKSTVLYLGNVAYTVKGEIKGALKLKKGTIAIADDAFSSQDGITSVSLPSTLKHIGADAFYGCTKLKSVKIPGKVVQIGEFAFYGCSALSKITVPSSVKNVGANAFHNTKWHKNQKSGKVIYVGKVAYDIKGTYPSKVTIKSGTTAIAEGLFTGNDRIKSVSLPSTVTKIAYAEFYDCDKLESVTIPKNVTSIGNEAFYSCDNLKTVAVGDKATTIGDYAFSYCAKLSQVTLGKRVKSIGWAAFDGCSSLKTVLYRGSKSAWKSVMVNYCNESLTCAKIKYNAK